jgi:carbonyl reductase 1
LDISDDLSIGRFARDMEEDYGGIDILVNNAAIAFKGSDPTPFKDQCFPTINPNFFGTLKLTESLLPLLRKASSPRLVTVASQAGHLRIIKSEELRNKFVNCGTLDELEGLMTSFVEDVQNGVHEEKGWPSSNYGMSKLGVIAMTRILARREEQMQPGTAMRITCCCPGYCATDMSSHKGTRTAEHGARTPAMLALAENCGSGGFYLDEAEVEW